MARTAIPALAETLARFMQAAGGISPETLAIETDGKLAANTIRAALQGYPPNVGNLQVLAAYFKTTVGELLGEQPVDRDPRLAVLDLFADDLTDSDIEALALMAKQLASARRLTAELPEEIRELAAHLPDSEKRAILRGEELKRKARQQLRAVAEEGGSYDSTAGKRERSARGGGGVGRSK